MRGAVWLLLGSVALGCSSEESTPSEVGRRSAPVVLLPESDNHVSGVLGRPAELGAGRRVEARTGDEPGESDLWLVEADGSAAPLCPAPGPDELPLAMPDGRVVFMSGRTTVTSLWIADPRTGVATQLTNHGLVAGKPWKSFVPPPSGDSARVEDGAIVYDDGSGRVWRVELATGNAKVEATP